MMHNFFTFSTKFLPGNVKKRENQNMSYSCPTHPPQVTFLAEMFYQFRRYGESTRRLPSTLVVSDNKSQQMHSATFISNCMSMFDVISILDLAEAAVIGRNRRGTFCYHCFHPSCCCCQCLSVVLRIMYRVQVYSFSCLVLVLPVHQVGWCTAVQKLGVERPGVQRGRESVHPTESGQLTLRPASSSPPCYTGLNTTWPQQKKHQKVHGVYLLNYKRTESTLHTSVGNSQVSTLAAPIPGQDRFLVLANSSPPAGSQHSRGGEEEEEEEWRRRRGGGVEGGRAEDIALRQDMANV